MRELSLFTGAGGGIWGSKLLGWSTVGYVEWDDYCQRVIRQRIDDGYFDRAPIFSDVRAFANIADRFRGLVDVVTAGFPCQPFSSAARGRNVAPDLWPSTLDVVERVAPRHVLLENVSGPRGRRVIKDAAIQLSALGYSCRWAELSAADLGAPHLGKRLWLVASTNRQGEPTIAEHVKVAVVPKASSPIWADVERGDLGVAHGDANRVNRLKAAGNAQIPRMVMEAWNRLAPEREE